MYYQIVLVFADGNNTYIPYAGNAPYEEANRQRQNSGAQDAYAEEIEMDDYKRLARNVKVRNTRNSVGF